MTVCGVNDFSTYGPVPTGFWFASLVGSVIFDQMCWGTTKVLSTLVWFTNWDEENVTVTSRPEAVGSVIGSALVLSAEYCLRSWNVYATSAAVIGVLSENVTLSRIVRVNVLYAASHDHFVASHGLPGSAGLTALVIT